MTTTELDRQPVPAATERLQRLLGDDDVRWLVTRLRQRIERGQTLEGQVTLTKVTPAQRRAVERLFGRPVGRGRTISVQLPALESLIARAGVAPDLRSAVERLTGTLVNRAAEREAAAQMWARAMAPLERAAAARAELEPWLAWLRATGTLQRASRGDPATAHQLAQKAEHILASLPANGVPLSVIAAEGGADGHALDVGRPLSVLRLRAAARLGGVPDGEGAEWRRTVWASVGVLCGELTNPVLTLNLPASSETPTGRVLRWCAEVGQPLHLTARQLLQDQPHLALRGALVYVCENPTVVAEAANRLGPKCAPLVCVSGHPAAAATVLLRQLASAGADLRYHGDFDWSGITITNTVMSRFGARHWRFDAPSYREAAARGPRLRGKPVPATWDPDLTGAMQRVAIKVEEERVLPALLADLAH